jgi:hypothetical protein
MRRTEGNDISYPRIALTAAGTPARPRAIDANWGTFVARVGDDDG